MKETLTVRVESETRESIDAIAEATDRDRSFVINEALSAYIDVYRWQVEHIQAAIREADAGRFVPESEVKRRITRLKKQ
jgi:RHH-type rel operon transcriptional repressor/antitoxin RelB